MAKKILETPIVSVTLFVIYMNAYCCKCESTTEIPTTLKERIEDISANYRSCIQERVAKGTTQTEALMNSNTTLTAKNKQCIEQFIANLSVENINLQNKLNACVEAAMAGSKALSKRRKIQELESESDLAICRKINANNKQGVTACVIEMIKERKMSAKKMMEAGSNEIENIARECSFIVLLDAQGGIAKLMSDTNTCAGETLLEM